jgi:ABC-type siderophore export system fused ATPase/permease subunit
MTKFSLSYFDATHKVTHDVQQLVKRKVSRISNFIVSLFAAVITLVSFLLLSLQVLYISLIWVLVNLLCRMNYRIPNQNIGHH